MSFPKRYPVKSFKGLLELSFFKHPQDCVLPFKRQSTRTNAILPHSHLHMPVPRALPTQEERLNAFIQKYELSLRENEVLNLIIEGDSNGEISEKLFISENTVKFHVRNILKKTRCSNRTELITALNRSE